MNENEKLYEAARLIKDHCARHSETCEGCCFSIGEDECFFMPFYEGATPESWNIDDIIKEGEE